MTAMWGRRRADVVTEAHLREAFTRKARNRSVFVDTPDENERRAQDLHRLRTLIADVVATGFAAPAPGWLTDELWARLVAEVPGVARPTDQAEGLFE